MKQIISFFYKIVVDYYINGWYLAFSGQLLKVLFMIKQLIQKCTFCAVVILLIAVTLGSSIIGFKAGRNDICDDLRYYYNSDKDLIKIRGCEGIWAIIY